MDAFDVVFFCSLLPILQSCRYEPWKSMGAIFQIFRGRRIQKTEWDNIPNLLTQGWESRKLFCPVQLMLGLWSNWLLKFREKRKVRQALGKGDKERSDKLFHFIFLMLPQASAPFVYTMFICGKTYHRESAIYCTSPCNCSFSGEEDSLIIIAANVCCQGAAMFSYSLASGNYSGAYLLFRTMISVRPCISKTLTSLFIICYWFTLVSKAQAQCSSFIGSHTGKMLNLALLLNVVFFSSLLSGFQLWRDERAGKGWQNIAAKIYHHFRTLSLHTKAPFD